MKARIASVPDAQNPHSRHANQAEGETQNQSAQINKSTIVSLAAVNMAAPTTVLSSSFVVPSDHTMDSDAD
jgi:hypothetical protein